MSTIGTAPHPPAPVRRDTPTGGGFGKVTVLADGYVGSPKVSGDGKTVTWDQVVKDNSEILQFSNGAVHQLTHDGHPSAYPAVSGDGSAVSFTRFSSTDPNDPNGNWDIYGIQNGAEVPIATSKGNEFFSDISRDGKTIVFDNDGDGSWQNSNIGKWQNGQVSSVTSGAGARIAPVIQGDGKRIYWDDGVSGHVWMQDEKGATAAFTTEPGLQYKPAVTPDGSTVLYTNNGGPDEDLHMIVAGGAPTVVSGDRKADETFAAVSADGKQIAWTRFDRTQPGNATVEIFLKDGDQVSQITTPSDGGLNTNPSLSDDGKTLAWLWVNPNDLGHCKIMMAQRDNPPAPPTK